MSVFNYIHRRQFENSNGKVEDMKPPIKRFTEGITYYSYGGPNATGASYKNISEDQDECDADVVGTDEQINGFLANDHETTDNHGTQLSEGKNICTVFFFTYLIVRRDS